MPFKINISEKGKTFKLDIDAEVLVGRKIGDKIEGKELKPELEGYELEITGTSDKAGFPGMKEVEGTALKKVLLKKGWGMKSRPRKEGKGKKRKMIKGLRLRKTVRGNTISRDTTQINMKVIKSGAKKLEEIFLKTEKAEQTEQSAGTKLPKQEIEKKAENPVEKTTEEKEKVKEGESK